MEAIGLFFVYALTAAFLENMVLTRTLGIGRIAFTGSLQKLLLHGGALTAMAFFGSLLAFAANTLLSGRQMTASGRALCYLACVTVVYAVFALAAAKAPPLEPVRRLLPLSAFNCAVLGALVLGVGSQRTLAAAAGYGLGSGVGYTLALLLIHTGRRRLELIPVPRAFRGMPILLLYIGIVSLAIYGLIGHQLPT